jgi:hypothetical protein
MDLDQLASQLDDFLQRFHDWCKPLNEFSAKNTPRINRGGYRPDDYRRELGELRQKLLAEYDPYAELDEIFDGLCAYYLTADSATRETVRKLVEDRRPLSDLIRNYGVHAAKKMTGPDDVSLLRNALAAISIENCQMDYRDTIMAIGAIRKQAKEAGVDAGPYFEEVGKLSSSKRPTGGCPPLSRMLGGCRRK